MVEAIVVRYDTVEGWPVVGGILDDTFAGSVIAVSDFGIVVGFEVVVAEQVVLVDGSMPTLMKKVFSLRMTKCKKILR